MEPLLGTVELFAFNFAPHGWLACEGQSLSIAQNAALYTLLGTMFGGDGMTTFNLPDLRGKAPTADLYYCIAVQGIYPTRP